MTDKIRIALVDDECLFQEGLALLFSNSENISVVLAANDGMEFLEQLKTIDPSQFPDIVLVDIQMKPMDGFELVEHLKIYPELKIIILSSHYKNVMFGHMIKLGVSAFLPKNSTKKLLVEAIETINEKGVFFTNKDHQMLRFYVKNKSQQRNFDSIDRLTEREIEVIKLICLEHTNQEIAEELFLSKRTIESHRQRILEKIGAKNTVGLVIYAISREIHTPFQSPSV
jgi:DNA-binding NarL/FixJ family response regulator